MSRRIGDSLQMNSNELFMRDAFAYWDGVFKEEALEEVVNFSKKIPEYVQDTFEKEIDGSALETLFKISKGNAITMNAVFVSILDILIRNYFDKNTSVIGVPAYQKEEKKNTKLLPFTYSLNSEQTFKQHLLAVKKKLEQFYHYQVYSLKNVSMLEGIQEEKLFLPFSIAMEELYTKEQLEQLKKRRSHLGIFISRKENSRNTNSMETPIIKMKFLYNKMKYSIEEVESFGNAFFWLIKQCMADLDQDLECLTLMDEQEKQKVLYEFNRTELCIPEGKTIVDLFEEQVKKHPDKMALVSGEESLTYAQLNRRANQVANLLIKKGLKTEQIVGILLNRSSLLIVSMLGVLKALGAYLPMDPEHPNDRIAYMLENSKAPFLLTETALKSKVLNFEHLIDLQEVLKEEDAAENYNPERELNSRNLSYVIYTSGSTGKPKGVMIEHEQVVNFVAGMEQEVKLSAYENMLGLTTVSFDIFGLEVWGSLLSGLKLVLTSQGSHMDGDSLAELLKKHPVDILQATPSRMVLLMESEKFLNALSAVKVLLVGGEGVPNHLLQRLQQYKNLQIFDVYGPTETTIWSTIKNVTTDDRITIGKPLANQKVYIMKDKKPCGIGVVGEICIGGRGVGRGYWDKVQLTNEKFFENPYQSGRIYRTGDLGKWRGNGTLECLGRMDDQVKVRGLRIELGEIVEVIRKQEKIKDATVSVSVKESKEQILCAYVVSDELLDLNGLKEELFQQLPAYMVPQYFMQLEQLPLNQNGKVDKKALPEISYQNLENYCAPRNDMEQVVADIFAEVFELEKVGIYDRFTDLGGNSLLAIKLHVAMEKHGFTFQVSDINRYKTVEQIAAHLNGEELVEEPIETETAVTKEEKKEGVYLAEMEPFNLFFYRSCFFNAAFAVTQYFKRDVLYYILNTMIVYDDALITNVDILSELELLGDGTSQKFFGLSYMEYLAIEETFQKDGISYYVRNDKENMVKNVIQGIEHGHPVIVGVDYFYESIRKDTYQKEHALHFIVVYGYHPKEKIFYIIEHLHRDNLSYEKREIQYEELLTAHKYAYELKNYELITKNLYYEFYENGSSNTTEAFLNPQKFYIDSFFTYQNEIESGLQKFESFIQTYQNMIAEEKDIEKNVSILISHVNTIVNAKSVEQYKLSRLFKEDTNVSEILAEIIDKWESVRIALAKCVYAKSFSKKRLLKNVDLLVDILSLERRFNNAVRSMNEDKTN